MNRTLISRRSRAVIVSAGLCALAGAASGASSSWLGTTDGSWSTIGNWDAGIVPGNNSGLSGTSADTASFTGFPTNRTIDVDLDRNVATLQFGTIALPDGVTSAYTVGSAINTGNPIYLSNGGAVHLLATDFGITASTPNEGKQVVINAPMILTGTTYSFISDAGATTETRPGLALYGNITAAAGAPTTLTFSTVGGSRASSRNEVQSQLADGPGGAVVSVIKDGPGCFEMNQGDAAPNTYSGVTILNGGVLRSSAVGAGSYNGLGGFSPNSHYIVNAGAELRNGAAGSTMKSVEIMPGGSMTVGTAASTTLNFASTSGPSFHFNFAAGQASFTVAGPFYLKGNVANEGGVKLTSGASTGTVTIGNSASVFDLGTVMRTFDIGRGIATNPFDLRLTGIVTGGGPGAGILKVGAGTLRFDGTANTWTGKLEIREGDVRGNIDNSFAGQPELLISGGNLHVFGTAGTNTQTFGPVTITKGSITAGSTLASTVRAPSFTFNVAAPDTVSIQAILADNGTAALVKNGSGTVSMTGANTYTGGTTVNGGALVVNTNSEDVIINPGAPGANITSGRIIFDYTGGDSPSTTIVPILTTGHGNNFSSGEIRSSTATSVFRLGYSDDGAGLFTVAYTRMGDANLSGTVDIDDFGLLAANFNLAGPWNKGDFNYSGAVDIDDFGLLAANFNLGVPAGTARGAAVPEPATLGALASAGLLWRRRRA